MPLDPDIATCMYHTGLGPFTKQPVTIAKGLRDRKHQRALMQFFKPENDFLVRDALAQAGRADLIGGCEGPDAVDGIPGPPLLGEAPAIPAAGSRPNTKNPDR